MKRNILKIAFMTTALAAGVLVSCNEDEIDPSKGEHSSRKVSFSISEDKTRTAYDDEDNLQINWVNGDQVRIFCDEAEDVKQADYTVINIGGKDGLSGNHIANLQAKEDGLAWGSDDEEHNFYAVYPADDKTIASMVDGKVTINANLNQYCTLGEKVGNMYETAPDMTNAIMVADVHTPPSDEVKLAFKPIMTTLEVIVRGANDNTAVKVSGISINMEASAYGASSKQFIYDINSGELVRGNLNSTVQFFVGIKDNPTLQLGSGESVKFTAFLPPVNINGDHKIKIRVHATGSTELVATIGGTTKNGTNIEIAQSSKRRITLPWIQNENKNNNNWITPLDGSIYVSQMSIPGSHDAATGEDMATIIGDIFASTQEQTLNKQWELGVRAFDLRPAIYDPSLSRTDELWLYHGMTRIAISWATAMNTIKAQLASNPGEFAIVLFRHENEGTIGKNNSDTDFNTYMTNYINQNKDWIVDWKPDLTINEARGKIILISRFNGSWDYGCFTGWGHGAEGVTTTLNNAANTLSATMYVQDYFNPSSHETKWNSIQKYLDISRTFHTDENKKNHWMINHCSGYTGTSSASTYRSNAAYQNPKLIEYLNKSDWEGSTGIILFDYAGASLSNGFISGSTEVYGDVALQTIIDNNYKYHMKRKGE